MRRNLKWLFGAFLLCRCNVYHNNELNNKRYFSTSKEYSVYASDLTKRCFTNYDYKVLESVVDSSTNWAKILHISERYTNEENCIGIWTYSWTGYRYVISGFPQRAAVLKYNDSLFILKKIDYIERVRHYNSFYVKYKKKFKKSEWIDIKRTILRAVFVEQDSANLLR